VMTSGSSAAATESGLAEFMSRSVNYTRWLKTAS
jgi:hypothetical protein